MITNSTGIVRKLHRLYSVICSVINYSKLLLHMEYVLLLYSNKYFVPNFNKKYGVSLSTKSALFDFKILINCFCRLGFCMQIKKKNVVNMLIFEYIYHYSVVPLNIHGSQIVVIIGLKMTCLIKNRNTLFPKNFKCGNDWSYLKLNSFTI